MLGWLADTWNSVELWVAQQSFWLQFVVVMAVLLPLCLGIAWMIDRIVDAVSAALWPSRDDETATADGVDGQVAPVRRGERS